LGKRKFSETTLFSHNLKKLQPILILYHVFPSSYRWSPPHAKYEEDISLTTTIKQTYGGPVAYHRCNLDTHWINEETEHTGERGDIQIITTGREYARDPSTGMSDPQSTGTGMEDPQDPDIEIGDFQNPGIETTDIPTNRE
jgi:hypothetical protein